MERCWYAFIGSAGQELDAGSYRKIIMPFCIFGNRICAIYAPSCGTFPDSPLSNKMQIYIILALTSPNVPQPNVPGAKYYVYLKPD